MWCDEASPTPAGQSAMVRAAKSDKTIRCEWDCTLSPSSTCGSAVRLSMAASNQRLSRQIKKYQSWSTAGAQSRINTSCIEQSELKPGAEVLLYTPSKCFNYYFILASAFLRVTIRQVTMAWECTEAGSISWNYADNLVQTFTLKKWN